MTVQPVYNQPYVTSVDFTILKRTALAPKEPRLHESSATQKRTWYRPGTINFTNTIKLDVWGQSLKAQEEEAGLLSESTNMLMVDSIRVFCLFVYLFGWLLLLFSYAKVAV